jgi:hypothetical protein
MATLLFPSIAVEARHGCHTAAAFCLRASHSQALPIVEPMV